MTGPAVAVRELHKRYGRVHALRGVSFQVPRGRIVGLVGPNGCGKTTLMRILVGRLRPDGGEARVGGVDPKHLVRGKVPLGYMPQQGGLYPDLTVAENITFFAALHGVPRPHRREAVLAALRHVALEDRAKTRVSALSGGMQRRASLAGAMVHRPAFLFLDEPTVGVDPEVRDTMWHDLRRLRDHGATIFLSTHYLGEADRCDDVLLMRQGGILAKGTPRQLLARTRTATMDDAFVALLRRRA